MTNISSTGTEPLVAAATILLLTACASDQSNTNGCAFPDPPTIVRQDGNTILQVWMIPETEVLSSTLLPADSAFMEYRRAIEAAGANLRRPIADRPQPANDAERQMWADEATNVDVAFGGDAGSVRPIQCLEALLFAYQNARYPQLTPPTEFIASILRRRIDDEVVLKIYFVASDQMFPPMSILGFDEIEKNVAEGWEFWTLLHNHTVQENQGEPALGVPAPSTSDVDLLRWLAEGSGLQNAWVTNGFYTIEISARAFDGYLGRR